MQTTRDYYHAPVVPDGFVGTVEAAKILGVTERTLSNLVARGKVSVYRRPGTHKNYYDAAALEEITRPAVATPDPIPLPESENDYVTRAELRELLESFLESRLAELMKPGVE